MNKLSKEGHHISNRIGRAIADFQLIEEGDKIIVAVSGGKDSLTLLKLLLARRRWAPIDYDIMAVHIVTDYRCKGCMHSSALERIFTEWQVPYKFIEIKICTDSTKKVSCFWCSWNRRKALFNLAREMRYNKIALGHHKDDIIETLLLNLFYKGEISSINARQPLFNGALTIIRPLVYIEEDRIRLFAKESGFPAQICRCPNSRLSNRAFMKKIIKEVKGTCDHVKSNLFKAPSRIKEGYLGSLSDEPRLNSTKK